MSLLDTLESVGPNNAELERCGALAVGAWRENASNHDDDENGDEDDFGAAVGKKKARDWLTEASGIAEETLVSSSCSDGHVPRISCV